MGTEYRLTFSYLDKVRVEQTVSGMADVQPVGAPTPGFEFRANPTKTGMPDGTALVETYGLYFCDHGGRGRDYLGQLVVALVREFGGVHVAELD